MQVVFKRVKTEPCVQKICGTSRHNKFRINVISGHLIAMNPMQWLRYAAEPDYAGSIPAPEACLYVPQHRCSVDCENSIYRTLLGHSVLMVFFHSQRDPIVCALRNFLLKLQMAGPVCHVLVILLSAKIFFPISHLDLFTLVTCYLDLPPQNSDVLNQMSVSIQEPP